MSSAKTAKRTYPRLGPGSAGVSMTVEEFDRIPNHHCNELYRYELIRGVLVVSPFAGPGEVSPNDELGYLLIKYQEEDPRGNIVDISLFEQYLFTTNRRRCDRAIWLGLGRMPDVETDFPAIIVEFVSPRKSDFLRDYEKKRDEYLAAGVREYWVVDRFRRTMTVFQLDEDGKATTQIVAEPQEYQTPLLPGFVLPLAHLLARADAVAPKKRKR